MHLPQTHPSLKIQNTHMSPGWTALPMATQNVFTPPPRPSLH
ncbi:hypothetical protein E2C01_047596 [Portunus trituberculatus]|uniref:Uncharacterized protein n=1 Tax=Portunus trituberculatus TaxID=210409 RepID=A0A5B7G9B7_PORTR|nr:hypothetical protein [Portunus trituberculatus]